MAEDPNPSPTPEPEPEPAPAPEPPADRTYTQAEVEAMIKDRVKGVHKKYEGFEELKTKAKRLDEIEAESQTELEQANARIAELERQAADATTTAQETRLRAAVVAEAAKQKAVDPADVFALLDRAEIEFDDDGNPKNLEAVVSSLLEAKPHLAASNGGVRPAGPDLGARGGGDGEQISREALKSMSPEAVREALKEGKLNTVLKGG